MNGYLCFYNGKQLEVYAETSLQAQEQAAKTFKAKKSYQVSTHLAEKNVVDGHGEQVFTTST